MVIQLECGSSTRVEAVPVDAVEAGHAVAARSEVGGAARDGDGVDVGIRETGVGGCVALPGRALEPGHAAVGGCDARGVVRDPDHGAAAHADRLDGVAGQPAVARVVVRPGGAVVHEDPVGPAAGPDPVELVDGQAEKVLADGVGIGVETCPGRAVVHGDAAGIAVDAGIVGRPDPVQRIDADAADGDIGGAAAEVGEDVPGGSGKARAAIAGAEPEGAVEILGDGVHAVVG